MLNNTKDSEKVTDVYHTPADSIEGSFFFGRAQRNFDIFRVLSVPKSGIREGTRPEKCEIRNTGLPRKVKYEIQPSRKGEIRNTDAHEILPGAKRTRGS